MSDDDLLRVGAGFDWITPLWQLLAGYTHCHLMTDDYFEASASRDALRASGIAARLFIGSSGYYVITKAPVPNEGIVNGPQVSLSNNVAMEPMVIVPGPSIWRTLGGVLGWLLGW